MSHKVINFLNAWSSTERYGPISLPNETLIPAVVYNGSLFIWNGTANPTFALIPPSDSAWTNASAYVYTPPASIFATLIQITGNVTTGAQTINGGTNYKSSNITVNATSLGLPVSRVMRMQAILNVTTGLTTGATFAWTASSATVNITDVIVVGASVTNSIYFVNGIVTTVAGSPTISLTASSVTGTPTLNTGTSIILSTLT